MTVISTCSILLTLKKSCKTPPYPKGIIRVEGPVEWVGDELNGHFFDQVERGAEKNLGGPVGSKTPPQWKSERPTYQPADSPG